MGNGDSRFIGPHAERTKLAFEEWRKTHGLGSLQGVPLSPKELADGDLDLFEMHRDLQQQLKVTYHEELGMHYARGLYDMLEVFKMAPDDPKVERRRQHMQYHLQMKPEVLKWMAERVARLKDASLCDLVRAGGWDVEPLFAPPAVSDLLQYLFQKDRAGWNDATNVLKSLLILHQHRGASSPPVAGPERRLLSEEDEAKYRPVLQDDRLIDQVVWLLLHAWPSTLRYHGGDDSRYAEARHDPHLILMRSEARWREILGRPRRGWWPLRTSATEDGAAAECAELIPLHWIRKRDHRDESRLDACIACVLAEKRRDLVERFRLAECGVPVTPRTPGRCRDAGAGVRQPPFPHPSSVARVPGRALEWLKHRAHGRGEEEEEDKQWLPVAGQPPPG